MASRVLMKGGIWKNTEDEILKVAVMKYGKNQWSRISSLLVRKTAKQCKARWYEWLDPSIKKTEWTREEEEKLLHLAKIMPTQWKTIAQCLEGRTAAQCLKQYEKLLDTAQNKGETEDDPRRLRPGEIDPNPESKPARPDPVDMDEDEKEMLSEARARLANTKGKKAKRKARERMLEEARRLAALQKRREMKAAGVSVPLFATTSRKKKKNQDIDLNSEIPFEKQPTPGFYDTTEEKQKVYKSGSFQPINLSELEGKNKTEEEMRLRKLDKEKNKKLKQENLPLYLEKINQLNKTNTLVKKSKMLLPNPQITDEDLENIVKFGKVSQNENEEMDENESRPTSSLLSENYFLTPSTLNPSSVVQRTPNRKDNLLEEAKNLIYLTNSSTPFSKSDPSTPLPNVDPKTVTNANNSSLPSTTPNIFKSPFKSGNNNVSFTPLSQKPSNPSSSPLTKGQSTPKRDHLQINTPNSSSSSGTPSTNQSSSLPNQKINIANLLKQKLSALPEPQYEYEIQLPSLQDDSEEEMDEIEDEGENSNKKKRKLANLQKSLFDNRTRVLKQNLPRAFPINSSNSSSSSLLDQEMLQLIKFESIYFPPPSTQSSSKKRKITLNDHKDSLQNKSSEEKEKEISEFLDIENHLETASNLINQELSSIGVEPLKVGEGEQRWIGLSENPLLKEMEEQIDQIHSSLLLDEDHKKYIDPQSKNKLQFLKQEYHKYKNQFASVSKNCNTIDKKLRVLHGGYLNRDQQISSQIDNIYQEIENANIDLHCFENLYEQEKHFAPLRIQNITEQLESEEEEQRILQRKFSTLKNKKERLHKLLNF